MYTNTGVVCVITKVYSIEFPSKILGNYLIKNQGLTMPKLERFPEKEADYAYGIVFLSRKHRLMKALHKRHQPKIYGHRPWESSFLVMDYLMHNPADDCRTAMELGCGWGGLSIFCAKHFGASVTAIDLDPAVFPYLGVLADINGVKVKHSVKDFTKLTGKYLGEAEIVVGSDICFWTSLVKPLALTVNRALNNGAKRVIISDPGRPTFYEFCELVGKRHNVLLQEWYSIEPDRYEGEVVEFTPKK